MCMSGQSGTGSLRQAHKHLIWGVISLAVQEMQDQMGRSLKTAVAEAMEEKDTTFERLGEAREHAAELQVCACYSRTNRLCILRGDSLVS
jgi:uncharacterized protein with PIN domain